MFTVFTSHFVKDEISHLFIKFLVNILKNKNPDDSLCQAETCYVNKYFYFLLLLCMIV